MTKIKSLFGKDKDIYRGIEKVVTFGNASDENLKNEVSKIAPLNDAFRQLLDKVDTQFLIARKRT